MSRKTSQLPLLRDLLAQEGVEEVGSLQVRCAYCDMSMWAVSDSARVDADNLIVCVGCDPHATTEEPDFTLDEQPNPSLGEADEDELRANMVMAIWGPDE